MIIHDEIRLARKVCMVTMYLNDMGGMYLNRTLALFMICYYEKLIQVLSSEIIQDDGYFACMVAFDICLYTEVKNVKWHNFCSCLRSLPFNMFVIQKGLLNICVISVGLLCSSC